MVRDYRHQFATRTPGSLFHLIRAIKAVTGVSYRYILTNAIQLYLVQRVPKDERLAIEKLTRAAQSDCADCAAETGPRRGR
jgi:hypothetical protein